MLARFFTFGVSTDRRVAHVEGLGEQVKGSWRLREGMRMGELFPPETELMLHKSGGNLVADFLDNIHSAVMVSEKARAVMEQEGMTSDRVEYLPFQLLDKKRRVLNVQFCVANALEMVECFDRERSEFETFPGKDKIIDTSVERIVLREEVVPSTAMFFRIKELPGTIVIRADLVERLLQAGCTGLSEIVIPTGSDLLGR